MACKVKSLLLRFNPSELTAGQKGFRQSARKRLNSLAEKLRISLVRPVYLLRQAVWLL
jgi:hypothetical protein